MTMMRSRLLLASLAAAATLAAGARQDRWEVVGPGGGGAMYYPTISPHDSSRVLLRCDMTGSYITNDAGESWRMFNLRTTTSFFVFDPVDPETIYTYSLGLWRSTDGGKGWSLIYPRPETVTGVRIAGDHGEESIQTEGAGYTSISALAVDPADSRKLYAAIGPWLHVSNDWGETWEYLAVLSDGASQIHVDPASPAEDRAVYIIGNRSVSVWQSGVLNVRQAPEEMPAFTDAALGFPEGGAPVVYATAGGVMIVSEDGGASWQRAADLPGTDASYSGVGTSLFHPDVVYLSYSNLTEPDGRYWFGVARSNDRGRTWEVVWKSGNKSPENIEDGWLPAAMGAGWAGPPIARGLGVAPNDPNVVYGTDYGRAIRSLDGGQTWQAAYSGKTEDDAYNTRGLDVTTCLRPALGPLRRQPRFHQLYRCGAVPQRDRREELALFRRGRHEGLAQHDLLDGVRPRSDGPRVGRDEQHPRPAASQDVAFQSALHLSGRHRPQRGRRQDVAQVLGRHAADGRYPHSARPHQPRRRPRALCRRIRPWGI